MASTAVLDAAKGRSVLGIRPRRCVGHERQDAGGLSPIDEAERYSNAIDDDDDAISVN